MADGNSNHENNAASASEPAPAVPDYLVSPDAVILDEGAKWRYGNPPDYSKTRKAWAETKQMNHAAGSLPQLVENLVKNWEIEASFKPRLQDWRTIDHENYTFAMNGGPPQSAEHMLKVGTYNAIICPNEYYSPEHSDFAASHKTFKRMMPYFAWEVIEVYSGPPIVAFKWRHWGEMKSDYVAFNDKGEKVMAKAHGGPIEIFGVTVAKVDANIRLQELDTWMDPLSMFRQIALHGIVNKEPCDHKVEKLLVGEGIPGNDGLDGDPENDHSTSDTGRIQDMPDLLHPRSADIEHGASSTMLAVAVDTFVAHSASIAGSAAHETLYGAGVPELAMRPSGLVEVQASEAVPLVVRSSSPRASSPTTKPGATQFDAGPEDIHMETVEYQETRTYSKLAESIVEKNTDAEIAPKRLKLDNEAQELAVEPSGIALDTVCQPREVSHSIYSSSVAGDVGDVMRTIGSEDAIRNTINADTSNALHRKFEESRHEEHAHPKDIEETVMPEVGEAVVAPATSDETHQTHQEMSTITPEEAETIMNEE